MLKMMGKRVAAAVLLVATMCGAAAQASALSDAAAALQPGQWKVLNKSGDASGFDMNLIISCGDDCGDVILDYADKGLWNPLTREMHFIGKGHYRELKHISYGEATNKWVREADPYWTCGAPWSSCYAIGHGYEHTTINPATGDIYARLWDSTQVYKWTRASKVWSQLPAAPNLTIALGIEYFPEMGGLVMAGNGEVHIYRESTKAWSKLGSGLSMGMYHNVARYDPVNKVVLFGGGNNSNQLYKLDATGKVSAIAPAPTSVGINSSVFTADPASGKYLLFGESGSFYEYDVPGNKWGALSTANVPVFSSDTNRIKWRVAVPISTYGVTAFLVSDGGDSNTQVLLYRHASGQATTVDTTPPSPPLSVSVK